RWRHALGPRRGRDRRRLRVQDDPGQPVAQVDFRADLARRRRRLRLRLPAGPAVGRGFGMGGSDALPQPPYEAWRRTLETLHRWVQIVGKVRLARAPMTDGWWQVPLYVTARGLSTSPIPAGDRVFELAFDFITHELRLDVSDGAVARIPLGPR